MRPQLARTVVLGSLVAGFVILPGAAAPAVAVFPGNVPGDLVFTSDRDGDAELYAMDPSGLPQARLTSERSQEVGAAVSPEGLNPFRQNAGIAYASDRTGSWDVYALRPDLQEVRLTLDAADDFAPAWSPRGDRIAFTSNRTGNRDLFTVSSTTPEGGLVNLTANPANDGAASWSSWSGADFGNSPCTLSAPRIAFHSNRGGSFDIWTVAETGGTPTQLTSGPDADFNPNWSPRCDFIAFERRRGRNYDIWVVRLSDRSETRLTFGAAADTDPVWAPDGSAIAFTTDRDGNEEVYTVELGSGPAPVPGRVTNRSNSPKAADYAADWEALEFPESGGVIRAPPGGGGPGALTCTKTAKPGGGVLRGTGGRDVLCGRGGADTLIGLGGADVLIGGAGADRLRGGGGDDELRAKDASRDRELLGGAGQRDRARYDEGQDPEPAGVENAL